MISPEKRRQYVSSRKTRLRALGLCHRHPKEKLLEDKAGCSLCRVWERNRERSYEKSRLQELKFTTFSAYGGVCVCCGLADYRFLSIDHILNDGKIDGAKGFRGGASLYRHLRDAGYPTDRYQLLCINCNFAKSQNDGVCPHEDDRITEDAARVHYALEMSLVASGDVF